MTRSSCSDRDPEMRNFDLTPAEKADLIVFPRALTDERTIDQLP